jgi:alcohol dehydrogenase (cytochrome c)
MPSPASLRRAFLRMLLGATLAPTPLLAQPPAAAPPPADWLTYNRTYQGERYSPLDQINTTNVAGLRPVCTFDVRDTLSFQTGPVVVGGVMYFTTDTATYAMDAATCRLRWRTGTGTKPGGLGVNRGVAYENGRLFRGVGAAHAQALDAASGRVLWDVPLGSPKPGETAPMAPVAWNGLVFIGNAGGDNKGVHGNVYALDQKDGRLVWHFDVIPDTGMARSTWRNRPGIPPTGGAFWSTFGLDPAQGVLYVPAGNPAPDFFPEYRPGENLYTNCVIALDARTGRMLGYIQVVKNDFHDWDVSTGPVVLTTRGGRPLIASANKDGLLSGIDRSRVGRPSTLPAGSIIDPLRTLVMVYQAPTSTRENMDLQLHIGPPVHYCPGTQGGSEWNGAAYHPGLNLLYAGAVDWCTTLKRVHPDSLTAEAGEAWAGGMAPHIFGKMDDTSRWRGWVSAVDADSGTVRWRYESPTPMLAGVTPTAGGLVLTGDLTGQTLALDARTGAVLWRHQTGNAIGGGVITYAVRGKQYVAVAAGMHSPNWPVPAQSNRIVVYALP